jgi:malic enzyme
MTVSYYWHALNSFILQGTAGVAIAGLLGAVRAQGRPMIDFPKQKIVVAGAGRLGFSFN